MGCWTSTEADFQVYRPILKPFRRRVDRVARLSSSQELLVAMYPYESKAERDLSFQKGDVLQLLNSDNPDWWYAQHEQSNRTGYVPRNFVAYKQTAESEEWYVGRVARSIAERLVLAFNSPKGTFLIRRRECEDIGYALTVRFTTTERTTETVKHYKINVLDDQNGYFISARRKFKTLQELVLFYSSKEELCCKLSKPAVRLTPTRPDLSSETQLNWEISNSQIEKIKRVGEGAFGEVWFGKWGGEVEVAVKMMKPNCMSVEGFKQEAQIMKNIDHPNIVKLYAVCTKEEPLCIITEYLKNGSLSKYLLEGPDLYLESAVSMAAQIANGMTYLERRKLVHRDLAARNVLVGEIIDNVPVVKIADFGLTRQLNDEYVYTMRNEGKLPLRWTAPEVLEKGFCVKTDVWSYGIVVYEIMTKGAMPYGNLPDKGLLQQIIDGYRMECPESCPDPIYRCMQKCWHKKQEKRPSFNQLFVFFNDYFEKEDSHYSDLV